MTRASRGQQLARARHAIEADAWSVQQTAAGVEDGHLADQAGHSVEMSRESYARSTVEQRAAVADAAARRFATGLLPKSARAADRAVTGAKGTGRKSAKRKK